MQGTLAGRIANLLLQIAYPAECPVCGEAPDSFLTSPICGKCWGEIKKYEGPSCGICSEPLVSEYAETCGRCLSKRPPFKRSLNYGTYSGALREAIRLLKFTSVKRLSRPLGMLLAGLDLPPADCIVPVPLSSKGLRERGFNQSLLVARHLSRASGIPLETAVLYKKKDTLPQVGLTRSARLQNLRGAFGTRRNIKGKAVLLIDDVITTGTTITECTKTLLRADAGEVYAASLARTGF